MADSQGINTMPENPEIRGFCEEDTVGHGAVEDEISQHLIQIEIVNPKTEYPVGIITSMKINVHCSEGCDVSGGTILIGDTEDRIIAEQSLTQFNKKQNVSTTGSFDVQIPNEMGEHVWNIIFYPLASDSSDSDSDNDFDSNFDGDSGGDPGSILEDDGLVSPIETESTALHAIAQIEYRFTTIPHYTRISMWLDSLDPVPVGEDYMVNIDINCVHDCLLYGQKLSIYQDDVLVATTEIKEPETPDKKPNVTRIQLTAPEKVGMSVLECRLEPEGADLAHKLSTHRLFLKTNKPAQCRLHLMALDKRDNSPIEYAYFLAIPEGGFSKFARADIKGNAHIDVPWGNVYVEVSQDDFVVTRKDIVIPEGQEEYDLTLIMPWRKLILD